MKSALELAAEMLGHSLTIKDRRYGATKHYWALCDCGYESGPGRSYKFAMSSAAGHLARIRDRQDEGIAR